MTSVKPCSAKIMYTAAVAACISLSDPAKYSVWSVISTYRFTAPFI